MRFYAINIGFYFQSRDAQNLIALKPEIMCFPVIDVV
jgi:hypothetical protein